MINLAFCCARCGNPTDVNASEQVIFRGTKFLDEYLEDVILCSECQNLVEKASELIENDKRVARFYERILKDRKKVELHLKKLEKKYYESQSQDTSFLKQTKKFAKKAYKANVIDAVVKATKKRMNPEYDEEAELEALLLEEIVEINNFLETPPIEFVICHFLIPKEEDQEEASEKNIYKGFTRTVIKDRFLNLDKDIQYKIAFSVVAIIGVISLVINILF